MSFELVILCEQPGSETSHSVWGQSVRGNGIWKGLTAQYLVFYRNIFNIQLCQILWWHVWGWVDNLTVETHLVEALLVGWGHPPHLQTPPQSSDASQTVSPKGFVLRPLHKVQLEELARFYQQLSFFPKSILKSLCVFLRVRIFSDMTSNKGPGPFVKTALDIFLRSYFFRLLTNYKSGKSKHETEGTYPWVRTFPSRASKPIYIAKKCAHYHICQRFHTRGYRNDLPPSLPCGIGAPDPW